MIQRVQTLYLLLAGVLSICTLFMPLAFLTTTSGELYDLYVSGVYTAMGEQLHGAIYMLVLAIIAAVLPFAAIVSFKNQMLQMRLCIVEMVILLGCYAMIGAYYYLSVRMFGDSAVDAKGFHPALFAPFAAIVASGLAARGAFRDLLLLRSIDRIR